MQSQKEREKNTLDKKSHQNDKWNHSQRLSNWICSPLKTAAYVNVPSQSPNFKEYNQAK